MRTVWLFLARVGTFIFLRWHLYQQWSYLYRWIYERKYKAVKLTTFAKLSMIPAYINYGKDWRSDSWQQLGDAVSTPEKAQQIFSGAEPVPKHGIDCDEHAVFEAATIEKSIETKLMQDNVANPKFFTVTWMNGWVGTGHNVCLLENPQPDGSVLYSYMDYGNPSAMKRTVHEVAEMIRAKYSEGKPYTGIVWMISKPDLTPVKAHWG